VGVDGYCVVVVMNCECEIVIFVVCGLVFDDCGCLLILNWLVFVVLVSCIQLFDSDDDGWVLLYCFVDVFGLLFEIVWGCM